MPIREQAGLAGDRRGPFAEVLYRLRPSLALHASASRYANNLDHEARVPTLQSSGYGAGLSWALPWKLSASADLNVIRLRQSGGEPSTVEPANRQILLSVGRPLGRQTLRFSGLDLNVRSGNASQRQQSAELEDTLVWRHLTLGAAVRVQRAREQATRNTLFFRGSAQINLRQASAYAQWQKGNDLLSQSLFATSSFSSTVFGLDVPLLKGARLQVEAFRNQMTATLNPASIFVLQNRGAEIPATLAGFNQWSVYSRVNRQFHWGRAGRELATGTPQVPLVGAVEGTVTVAASTGTPDVAGIAIMLDNGRTARTDLRGCYKFIDVPEGEHEVKLALRELPAEFEPGPSSIARVNVAPRTIARADFSVQRLTSLVGKVVVPPGVSPDAIIIHLVPTKRYTTPDADGSFGFYNLPEGDYQVTIDTQTLPEESALESAPSQSVSVHADQPSPALEFQIAPHVQEKPVRVLFEQEIRTSRRQQ